MYELAEEVGEQRAATVENVQRKQASTMDERERDEEGEGAADEAAETSEQKQKAAEDEGDDEVPYNPKDVPLGWDGKPIPYWLYKLHGLNLYFTCEICGNSTYRGPLAFQRHFTVRSPSPIRTLEVEFKPQSQSQSALNLQKFHMYSFNFNRILHSNFDYRSGGTLTACGVWASRTPRISIISPKLTKHSDVCFFFGLVRLMTFGNSHSNKQHD